MSSDFVRGGQISLHSLRMLRQVFASLYMLALVMSAIIIAYYCLLKITSYQCQVMIWYFISQLYITLKKPHHQINIRDEYGDSNNIFVSDFASSSGVLATKQYIINTLVEGVVITSLIVGILFLFVIIWFFWKGKKVSGDQELRGNSLVSSEVLRRKILKDNKEYKAYLLGNVPYPSHAEQLHTLIAGSTGSGKTVLISNLIDEIKRRGDRAIIYDKMGIYTERFYDSQKDILLNPFDKRSPQWSIFKEVKSEANFDSIAAALIPLEKSTVDPFWIKAARTLFSEVCGSLLKQGGVSNSVLVNTLLKKNLNEAATLVKGTAAQAIIDEQSPKTALSVMSVLSTYLKCLKFLRDEGEVFSIREWVLNEEGQGSIFITSTGDLHATLLPLISSWIEISINNILSLPRNRDRKIWIILDELPSLHHLPSLEQGLAEIRQFGGCFLLSIQSISQLRGKYGMNGSQTISSLCSNKVFLRAGDYDSARWYSDNIGLVEVDEFREGVSYGAHPMRDGVNVNRYKQIRHLVLPTELINLKDMKGYFCMAKGYPVTKNSFEYVNWEIKNPKFEESIALISESEEVQTTAKDSNNNTEEAKKESNIDNATNAEEEKDERENYYA